MLRHDLTNGRHLMPVSRANESFGTTRTRTSTCSESGGGGGGIGVGGSFNRVSANDLNQKLLWRAESLSPMSDARKRLFRKLAITLLLVNIERLDELDRIAAEEEEARNRAGGDESSRSEKTPVSFPPPSVVGAHESYSIRNAKPSQHSPPDHRRRPTPIDPSPTTAPAIAVAVDDDDNDSLLQIADHDEQIWHRKSKKTLSWRVKPCVKPSETLRHNNTTSKAIVVADRRKPKCQSFAIDQLEGNLIARVTTV